MENDEIRREVFFIELRRELYPQVKYNIHELEDGAQILVALGHRFGHASIDHICMEAQEGDDLSHYSGLSNEATKALLRLRGYPQVGFILTRGSFQIDDDQLVIVNYSTEQPGLTRKFERLLREYFQSRGIRISEMTFEVV